MRRIAIYTRVSTTDKGQTVENQVHAIEQDCAARKWDIVLRESDYITGTKTRRPGLDRIFASAERGEFDTLVVWSLDRLTREGALRALEIIQYLGKLNVTFISLQEPHFDTCGPFKDAIIAIAATLAKLEREKIVERVNAGLDRSRLESAQIIAHKLYGDGGKAFVTPTKPCFHLSRDGGKTVISSGDSWQRVFANIGVRGPVFGRPAVAPIIASRVLELANEGKTIATICSSIKYRMRNGTITNPSKATVRKIINQHRGLAA